MSVIIIGLGPGATEQMSLGAWRALESASEVYLRTSKHPAVPSLPSHLHLHSFDVVYETGNSLEAVYSEIVQQVLALGQRPEGVVYAVPGHPLVAEETVLRILAQAPEANLPVQIIASGSYVSAAMVALGLDGSNLQVLDTAALAQRWHPTINVDLPALLGPMHDRDTAANLKLTLMSAYPMAHEVVLLHAAGTTEQEIRHLPLYELDRQDSIDHLSVLYVPPRKEIASLESFQDTVARLRAPDGCPWDREQTHLSLRETLLEETYEVLQALDEADTHELCVELGDLLMQICMHAQIASEEEEFNIYDVVAGIDSKIKRRHPHVFGDVHVQDSQEVLRNWEEIKKSERGDKDNHSLLYGVPGGLPALAQANAYQKRVARVNFDWKEIEPVWQKINEELAELRAAAADNREAELGDVLFAVVNLSRHMDIDPEAALRNTNNRFRRRFERMQEIAVERGLDFPSLSLEEQDKLWEIVKAESL